MKLSTVHFSELVNYNDSNSIVMTGVTLTEEDIPSVEEFFHESNIAPEGKNIVAISKILDNVLGDDGRTDWLVIFDHAEDKQFNPMCRLVNGSWIKWTSDFIDNFSRDYAA